MTPLFVHAADIHLDSPLKGLCPYEGSPRAEEIRGATRQALENLVALVLSEKVPLLIIAGDLYDGDWPDFNTGLFFIKQMQRLHEAGVRVAVVRGNHDAANSMTRSLVMPDNVTVFSARAPRTWVLEDLALAVHGQSYGAPEVFENLAAGYPDPIAGMLNIGVLHCLLAGTAGHSPYASCSLDDLAAKAYDYWALGHVHAYKVLRRQPWILYSGCCQGRHIKESGQKGCVMVSRDKGALHPEFIALDTVRWAEVTVDVQGAETLAQVSARFAGELERCLPGFDGRIACVRGVLTGRSDLHGQLCLDPENLTANLRAVTTDVSRQRAWLESVQLETGPRIDLDRMAQSDTPQGELLRILDELGAVTGLEQALELDLTPLKAKLAGTGVAFPDDADLIGLLAGSRDILMALLSEMDKGDAGS